MSAGVDQDQDVLDIAVELAAALEAAGVACALGGALALGFWGSPRATIDVDMNLFVSIPEAARAVDVLRHLGAEVDTTSLEPAGMLRARLRGRRVELFLSFHPLHDSARERAERVDLGDGRSVAVLTAEDLSLFKALYGRPKDFVDVERMLAVLGADFDREYARTWMVRMLPAGDARRVELERLLAVT